MDPLQLVYHLPTGKHLYHFYLLGLIKSVAINICEDLFSLLWRIYPRVELLSCVVILHSYHRHMLNPFPFAQVCLKVPISLHCCQHLFFYVFLKKYLFVWLHQVLVGAGRVFLVSWGIFSLCTIVHRVSSCVMQTLEQAGSAVVGHRLSCCEAHGIFLDQGLNPCLLHWQVDSLSVSYQGSTTPMFYWRVYTVMSWYPWGIGSRTP